MVDFEYWFNNIVSYCDFITSTAPQRVWVEGEKNVTSADDCEEFLEQTLGDLDLEELISEFAHRLRSIAAYEVVAVFCHALLLFEQYFNTQQPNAQELLASSEWRGLEVAARAVMAVPAAQERLLQMRRY
jgi:hypothetical protein